MKRLIGAVVVVMACLVMAGGAFAFDYTDHVATAPNGEGDLLIFPVYLATGGEFAIQTKLTVVNTSLTECVVAKVVFRSHVFSQELLDFLIYLSPTDMWIGTVEFGPNGPRVVSSDESGPTLIPGQPLISTDCTEDSNDIGYVEVIEAYSVNLGAPKVEKAEIKAAYDASVAPYTAAQTINTLAGSYMISIPAVGWEAEENAFVMQNYNNTAYLNPTIETILGQQALNTTQEIEAGFNKDLIAMTYNSSAATGGTLHVFTFPTKLSDSADCDRVSRASNYFDPDGLVHYRLNVFDNEEHTTTDPDNPFSPQNPQEITMPDEVTFRAVPGGIFDFGWSLYTFNKVGGTSGLTAGPVGAPLPLTYSGTPVIPTIIDFKDGLSIHMGAWVNGVVTDGTPTGVLNDYQYTTLYVPTTAG